MQPKNQIETEGDGLQRVPRLRVRRHELSCVFPRVTQWYCTAKCDSEPSCGRCAAFLYGSPGSARNRWRNCVLAVYDLAPASTSRNAKLVSRRVTPGSRDNSFWCRRP